MKKRLSITTISVVCAVLLLCGWTAYAAASSGAAASSASLTGAFKSLSPNGTQTQMIVTTDKGEQTLPLAKSVWVYRNGQKAQLSDLKPGDRIEAIVNSKNQAAYIKAASEQPAAPVGQQAETPTPPTTNPPASAAPQPSPPAAAAPPANAGPTGSPPQAHNANSSFDDLELKVDGKHFKLHIEPGHGIDGTRYELNLKPEGGGTIHLKGDEAASWIKDLLASVDLQSASAQKQLLQAIADRFGIDSGKLHVQMNAESKQTAALMKQPQVDVNDDGSNQDGDHDGSNQADQGKKAIQKSDAKQKHGKEHDKEERD